MRDKFLFKTDKNGTKHYADYTCTKCGGAGARPEWAYTGSVCYKCNGSGKQDKAVVTKVYTTEYKAKLDMRREKVAAKKLQELILKAPQLNKEFFEKMGFDVNGKTYVVLGKTYELKDKLKEDGSKFNHLLGWHFAESKSDYKTFELDIQQCYTKNEAGIYVDIETDDIKNIIKNANDDLVSSESKSEHLGQLKDKITLSCTVCGIYSFDSRFAFDTKTYIYSFTDSNDNVIIGKTGKELEFEVGKVVTLSGTVKDHAIYNGKKQTILTRCKVN